MREGKHIVFVFANGVLAVCGPDGQQIPELQTRPWLLMVGEFLRENGVDLSKCELVLPGGKAAEFETKADGGIGWRVK